MICLQPISDPLADRVGGGRGGTFRYGEMYEQLAQLQEKLVCGSIMEDQNQDMAFLGKSESPDTKSKGC